MLSGLFSKKERPTVSWKELTDTATLDTIDQESQQKPVLLFKHSTRCSISSMVLNKFESSVQENPGFDMYFLDLISYRDVSNAISERYGVVHQSPQAILISNGKAIYDESHTGIIYQEISKKSAEQI